MTKSMKLLRLPRYKTGRKKNEEKMMPRTAKKWFESHVHFLAKVIDFIPINLFWHLLETNLVHIHVHASLTRSNVSTLFFFRCFSRSL